MRAVLASYNRPRQIYNYVSMHTALAADRLMTRAPAYAAVDWVTALAELDRINHGSANYLLEPEVNRLENYVRQRTAALGPRRPWALALNSDLTLAKCLYTICRAVSPNIVVETGVAYGLSSAFILQALAANRRGTLHSIDLPLPGAGADNLVGALIPGQLRDRWQLHLGPSRRELPRIANSQPIDIFLHDSLHTSRNMRREFQAVWPHLPPGGVLVSDDVEGNGAFEALREQQPQYWQVVTQEGKTSSLFGIAIKRAIA